jgi:hypothetical protein
MPWQKLGEPAPDRLPATREQLHCVAQVLASVPRVIAPPAEDWSHSAFEWDEQRQALVSIEIPADVRFRVGLRIADATALVLDAAGSEIAAQPADGMKIEELFAWLKRQVVDLTSSALPRPLARAEGGLPEPCAAGQTFDLADGPALAELARYYDNANRLIQQIHADHPGASPVRTWPHHMDMALLITLDPERDPEEARSVSFGMQPGDGSYAEPYFYSSPWPYPEPESWPALDGGGAWHTEGFVAAVLLASQLVAAGDAAAQQRTLEDFARSAIKANRSLLTD